MKPIEAVYNALKSHYHGEVAPRNLYVPGEITYQAKLRYLSKLVEQGRAVKISRGVHARYKAVK